MSRRPLPTRLLLLAIGLVCMSALARPACAMHSHHPAKQNAKQQVADLELQWRAATLNADLPLMDKLLSDEYVGISMTGQVNTKAMQLDRLRNRTFVLRRMDLSDMKVRIVGSIAIVTSRAEVEGTNEGKDMQGVYRYTRIYQRSPSGAWKITNFEVTRVPGLIPSPNSASQNIVRPLR